MVEPRDGHDQPDVEALLAGLNPVQQEAVVHVDGPLLVLAGAGSGKTRVIAQRIAYLVARGVNPRQILAVTFTNKAAGEMAQRVAAILAARPGRGRPPLVATFHATCARVLRAEIHHLGYPRSFVIYDEDDRLALVRECYKELGLDERLARPGGGDRPDLARQEPAPRARGGRGARAGAARGRRGAALRTVRGPAPRAGRGRLRRPPGLDGRALHAAPGRPRLLPGPLAVRPRRRVPGHQRRPVPTAAPADRRPPEPLRRRRSRPVHLPVPGRGPPEHPGLRAGLSGVPRRPPRAELSLDGPDPRDRRGRDRAQPGAQGEGPLDRERAR